MKLTFKQLQYSVVISEALLHGLVRYFVISMLQYTSSYLDCNTMRWLMEYVLPFMVLLGLLNLI